MERYKQLKDYDTNMFDKNLYYKDKFGNESGMLVESFID
jgi:hypothetical protein